MPDDEKKKKAKTNHSIMGEIRQSNAKNGGLCSDPQKVCKWALIIGIPTALLIVVVIVVAVMFSQN